MKLKFGFLITLILFAFLFFSCDWLLEDDNKENPPVNGNQPGDNFVYEAGTALLQTKWNQSSPYNDMFPYMPEHSKANSRNGRLVTDCVTTAAAQIIAFHRYPARATGQSTVLGPHGIDVSSVNFEDYPFDWANMRNTYTTADSGTVHGNAAAQLNYIYGMARGSGAGFAQVLINHFAYDRSLQYHSRKYYTDTDWENLIRKQLDSGFPVYYYGNYPTDAASSDGYHAFVVDGYDNSGKFHANWGWGGNHDGWYFINDFDPKAPASTYAGEHIFINIKPDAGSAGSNIMGIENFNTSKSTVPQNEIFTVTFTLRSFGFFSGGQRGAALIDANGNIIQIIGSGNTTEWRPGSSASVTVNCYVPETITPGPCRIMAVTRLTDGEWKIVSLSDVRNNIPNAVNINVTANANGGGYGMGLTLFTADPTTASKNGTFTVTLRLRNYGSEVFNGGQRRIVLVDNSGNVTEAGFSTISGTWNPGSVSSNDAIINCTVPASLQAGQYKLRVMIRPGNNTDNNEWRFATLSNDGVPTSIDFTVQ